VVSNGYQREFVYVYGAVSPLEGDLDWRLCREMNTLRMGEFLLQVSQAHPTEFMVMVVDGASSHKAKDLVIPDNIRLLALPPYAPELNPQEHIWEGLREKEFPNRVLTIYNRCGGSAAGGSGNRTVAGAGSTLHATVHHGGR
jgi:hypothetical protein